MPAALNTTSLFAGPGISENGPLKAQVQANSDVKPFDSFLDSDIDAASLAVSNAKIVTAQTAPLLVQNDNTSGLKNEDLELTDFIVANPLIDPASQPIVAEGLSTEQTDSPNLVAKNFASAGSSQTVRQTSSPNAAAIVPTPATQLSDIDHASSVVDNGSVEINQTAETIEQAINNSPDAPVVTTTDQTLVDDQPAITQAVKDQPKSPDNVTQEISPVIPSRQVDDVRQPAEVADVNEQITNLKVQDGGNEETELQVPGEPIIANDAPPQSTTVAQSETEKLAIADSKSIDHDVTSKTPTIDAATADAPETQSIAEPITDTPDEVIATAPITVDARIDSAESPTVTQVNVQANAQANVKANVQANVNANSQGESLTNAQGDSRQQDTKTDLQPSTMESSLEISDNTSSLVNAATTEIDVAIQGTQPSQETSVVDAGVVNPEIVPDLDTEPQRVDRSTSLHTAIDNSAATERTIASMLNDPAATSVFGGTSLAIERGPAVASFAESIPGVGSASHIVTQQASAAMAHVLESSDGKSKTMQFDLHPAELGKLTIQITQSGEAIAAQIIASEILSSEVLAAQKASLQESLSNLGFEQASVDISHDSESFRQQQEDKQTFTTKPTSNFKTAPVVVQSGARSSSPGLNILA
ncbi:MAG: flagellar hook-length control protein FliK [Pirellulaceae bacterium]